MTPSTPELDLGRWRTALVYGLGVSGRAAVRLLARRGVRAEGVDRVEMPELRRELPELAVLHREDRLSTVPSGVDGLVLSPGVAPDRPLVREARRRGMPVVAEVELAFQYLQGRRGDRAPLPVIGVTGSNGKSTTTALTGALLSAAGREVRVCGNIGHAFSEAVLEWQSVGPGETVPDDLDWVFVVELSSFQIEGLHRFRPRAAAYLNLSPDHMDRYPDLDAYAAAKEGLLARMGPEDTAVLNLDDRRSAAASTRARTRYFTRLHRPGDPLPAGGVFRDGCHVAGDRVVEVSADAASELLFERTDLTLAGEHNLENAMAAALLARALGASAEAIRRGLASFTGLPHRMEKVAEMSVGEGHGQGRVVFWNDSKGTNPAATLRSLEGLADGAVHLILGGRSKGTDFRELASGVRRKAKHVYLIGEAAAEIAAALGEEREGGARISHCGSLERAVAEALRNVQTEPRAGETAVLLSPACASFDQFRSFAHRGEEFRRLVRERLADRGTVDTNREEARRGDQAGV